MKNSENISIDQLEITFEPNVIKTLYVDKNNKVIQKTIEEELPNKKVSVFSRTKEKNKEIILNDFSESLKKGLIKFTKLECNFTNKFILFNSFFNSKIYPISELHQIYTKKETQGRGFFAFSIDQSLILDFGEKKHIQLKLNQYLPPKGSKKELEILTTYLFILKKLYPHIKIGHQNDYNYTNVNEDIIYFETN
ncbi:MAG: hypothetical protein ABH951_01585 [Patescibacteria group bacterium]